MGIEESGLIINHQKIDQTAVVVFTGKIYIMSKALWCPIIKFQNFENLVAQITLMEKQF